MVKDVAEHVEKANLLYITGDAGLNVIAQGSYPVSYTHLTLPTT